MLNYFYIISGPGSSPDPNIYYRTQNILKESCLIAGQLFFVGFRSLGNPPDANGEPNLPLRLCDKVNGCLQ